MSSVTQGPLDITFWHISKSDQDWLDGAANLVDEECLIETMERAIDYDSGIAGLSPREWVIVEELMKLVGGKGDESVKKQKCKCHNGDQK